MKIKAIRISGFRGIPPIDPPNVNISLCKGHVPQNVLIFGPNAYGKSSISSALEWFFRENVHCSEYFEDYLSSDNVHVNVGKPGYPENAFIEIDVIDQGIVKTVRKEIGVDGYKVGESIDGLEQQLSTCFDEIITLDHDEFRNFVSAASKDKWATFASLIGYEELDNFRSGLTSLFQRSISDYLQIASLEKKKTALEKTFNSDKAILCNRYSLSAKSALEDIEKAFLDRLSLTLISLQLQIPHLSELDEKFWGKIRQIVIPSEGYRQNAERLEQLKKVTTDLTPFSKELIANLKDIKTKATYLNTKKAQFDKGILSEFYRLGLEIIQSGKTDQNECPFCKTEYDNDLLKLTVKEKIKDLNFEEVQQQANLLTSIWNDIKNSLAVRVLSLYKHELSNIASITGALPSVSEVDNAIKLSSFDANTVVNWVKGVLHLHDELIKTSKEIKAEIERIATIIKNNPEGQLGTEIEDLYVFWKGILSLFEKKGEISAVSHEIEVTKDVIDHLRTISKNFRDELEDFSVRVIVIINDDVSSYYDALHPNDDIKPFLETHLDGQKRSVLLKCDYKGYEGKDAASLLSESHRNSLGLAVMLAFMKYKRQTGSPVEFLILDDVTQSFDVGHRVNLVSFLEDPDFPEICSNQIIMLTYDRTLADFIQRPGEERENWLRYDIRTWHLNALVIEPNDYDLLDMAAKYLAAGDEMASAIYARHALEQVYKFIVETASLSITYSSKPWKLNLNSFQLAILKEVKRLWSIKVQRGTETLPRGLINPQKFRDKKLTMSLRILHLTVHDSDFMENPPSTGDIRAALDAIKELRDMFTCLTCRQHTPNPIYTYFHTFDKGAQAADVKCKKCGQPFPAD